MRDDQPYARQWWMRYFNVQIAQSAPLVRFKRNIFTRAVWVFQSNCCPTGNRWNEPGYGWGVWRKL